MSEHKLNETAEEDIHVVLVEIGLSLGIQFKNNDFAHVKNFGELCDTIESKIDLPDTNGCTSQQAFYKLRKALGDLTPLATITPDSQLSDLLPRRNRRQAWQRVEAQLGFRIGLFGLSGFMTWLIFGAYLAALAAFFSSGRLGLTSLMLATALAYIAGQTSRTLQLGTIRECVEKMTQEHYLKSRRNPATVNRAEVTPLIRELFINKLALTPIALTRESTLV